MQDPGEFYSLIAAGPHRGIPALHIVETPDMVEELLLPDVVTKFADVVGFARGKSFIYLSRQVDPRFVQTLRELGFYVIADVGIDEKAPWVPEANHIMVGATDVQYVGGHIDSFVYIYQPGHKLQEPEFMPETQNIPKFLYVAQVDGEVLNFLNNAKYPWSVQITQPTPFKVPIRF